MSSSTSFRSTRSTAKTAMIVASPIETFRSIKVESEDPSSVREEKMMKMSKKVIAGTAQMSAQITKRAGKSRMISGVSVKTQGTSTSHSGPHPGPPTGLLAGRAMRPPFPAGWRKLEVGMEDLVLANTLPVGQSFLWHRAELSPSEPSSSSLGHPFVQPSQPLPDRRAISTKETSSSASTEQPNRSAKTISTGLSEHSENPFFPSPSPVPRIKEEFSRAISCPRSGRPRVLCLRQDERSGTIWYASIPSSGTSPDGSLGVEEDALNESTPPGPSRKRRRLDEISGPQSRTTLTSSTSISSVGENEDVDETFLKDYFQFDLVPPASQAGPSRLPISSASSVQINPATPIKIQQAVTGLPTPPPTPLTDLPIHSRNAEDAYAPSPSGPSGSGRSRSLKGWYSHWADIDPLLFGKVYHAGRTPRGVRVLRQDPWETVIAFITSSANNVPRITSLMHKLCQHYGSPVLRLPAPASDGATTTEADTDESDRTYYSFPRPRDLLADADLEQTLRGLGFGYRGGFIASALHSLATSHGSKEDFSLSSMDVPDSSDGLGIEAFLHSLRSPVEVGTWKQELLEWKGVGRKVADCIGLMALDKASAVPIDTHLQQIAARHPSFPARLKTKSPSTEKVYAEVQTFLRDLWTGSPASDAAEAFLQAATHVDGEAEDSATSVKNKSSQTRTVTPTKKKQRKSSSQDTGKHPSSSPSTKDREIGEAHVTPSDSGGSMAGWAQAVMFASDLKGSTAVALDAEVDAVMV